MGPVDLPGGDDPLVGLRRRHADVDDGDVRIQLVDPAKQLIRRRRRPDDVDPSVGEQPGHTLTQAASSRRRSRRAWDLRSEHDPVGAAGLDAQRAVEGADPVLEFDQRVRLGGGLDVDVQAAVSARQR